MMTADWGGQKTWATGEGFVLGLWNGLEKVGIMGSYELVYSEQWNSFIYLRRETFIVKRNYTLGSIGSFTCGSALIACIWAGLTRIMSHRHVK